MKEILGAIALGAAIGLASGFFGVGGSSISTPLLRLLLGTPPLLALASPLPVAIPTAIAGSIAYRRQGLINTRVVLWSVAGGLPAIVLGSLLTNRVSGHWLMIFVAIGVIVAGMRLATQRNSSRAYLSVRWRAAPGARVLAIGALVGFLAGLLANGGGFLLVPVYVVLFGARMREAAATSLPCVALLAIPGTATHALLGHIDAKLALELAVGVLPATFLGAELSLRWRNVTLRQPFGAFMLVFGVYFLISELTRSA